MLSTDNIPIATQLNSMTTHNKIGVVLLNMGGPEKLDDVRPFLYNLFSDREIIRLGPRLLQKPIAWQIARKRAPKSKAIYEKIGGRSPLAEITGQQGTALELSLNESGDFQVSCAMRYWRPNALDALNHLKKKSITEIIALTLYPHFSKATTGSSLRDLKCANATMGNYFKITEISAWPEHPLYIECLAENIINGLKKFKGKPTRILYSAHSLPVSFIEEGDPYVDHLKATIRAIEKITEMRGKLCYQSKSGPVQWLAPSTPEMLEQLAKEGCENILMVPISFVSDHVETLYEIDIDYRQRAKKIGIQLIASESLNTNPKFIACLKDLVLQHTAP